MKSITRFIPLVVLVLVATRTDGRTWYIKPDGTGDAPTIQAGVDSARAGDDVLLAAGTYSWTSQAASGRWMVAMKPGITLGSEKGAAATILDGEGKRGTVVLCRDVGDDVRITGLTIRGGIGWYVPGDPLFFEWGGGISAFENSRPTIDNCIFRDNVVGVGGRGGAVSCASGGVITNCQVLDTRGEWGGAGIFCRECVVSFCTIRNNRSGGCGAGIYAIDATISDCSIDDNVAYSGAHGCSVGAGVYVYTGTASTTIVRCTFVRNISRFGGGVHADGPCAILDCIFLANRADRGAAIYGGPLTIAGCTFVGNTGDRSIISVSGELRSCIIARNTGRPCDTTSMTVSCTNVYANSLGDDLGGVDGGGNFSADPEFCAADPVTSQSVVIQSDSPCAPGNRPIACGLIGAAPVGCGTTAVATTSWTDAKRLYR